MYYFRATMLDLSVQDNMIYLTRKKGVFLLLVVAFAAVYISISIVNHYLFRTFALDLGLYTNALFNFRSFCIPDGSMLQNFVSNQLADHFDLTLVVFSPFSWLFGSYTLLLFQLGFVLSGGLGVYRLLSFTTNSHRLAWIGAFVFYAHFGVLSAMAFDYHPDVVAASLLPWLMYALLLQRFRAFWLVLFAMLISKETIGFWLVFVCLALMIENKNKMLRKHLALGAGVSFTYFTLITFVLMPYLANTEENVHFDYAILGADATTALRTILLNPLFAIETLFVNPILDTPSHDFIKVELWITLLLSGAWMLSKKPAYLLMIIPIICLRLWHDNPYVWGVTNHYNVPFAPVVAIGAISSVYSIKNSFMRKLLLFLLISGVVATSIYIMDSSIALIDRNKIRFYTKNHYQRNYSVEEVYRVLKEIPSSASVSAQSPFVPHLSLRKEIYQYPKVEHAEYIVLSLQEGTYPLERAAFEEQILLLRESGEYVVVTESDAIILFQRRE